MRGARASYHSRVSDIGPIPPGRAIRRPAPAGEVVPRSPVEHEYDDDDGPSPDDIERFGDVTRPCPSCGKHISDQAQQCHWCGEWVSTPREVVRMSTLNKIIVALLIMVFVLAVLVRIL